MPKRTAWVNYLRCHDDIGWTFDDADAAALGINAYDHRQFLNRFYTGQFKGSFARGIPFQENLETGDMRIAGTLASLAGLEKAIEENSDAEKELAIKRMLLLQGVTLSIGGIPLIYLGEEWAMLNDYDFIKDPAKAGDTRWVHRPKMRWEFLSELDGGSESQARIDSKTRLSIASTDDRGSQIVTGTCRSKHGIDVDEQFARAWIRSLPRKPPIDRGGKLLGDRGVRFPGMCCVRPGSGDSSRTRFPRPRIRPATDISLEPYQISWLRRV